MNPTPSIQSCGNILLANLKNANIDPTDSAQCLAFIKQIQDYLNTPGANPIAVIQDYLKTLAVQIQFDLAILNNLTCDDVKTIVQNDNTHFAANLDLINKVSTVLNGTVKDAQKAYEQVVKKITIYNCFVAELNKKYNSKIALVNLPQSPVKVYERRMLYVAIILLTIILAVYLVKNL